MTSGGATWSCPWCRRRQPHDATTVSVLQPVPGRGTLLRLVLWEAIPGLARVPRGQDGVASCRLVTCATASAGTRDGPSGTTLGTAALPWAFSAAAVLLLRNHPGGQQYLARLEHTDGQGTALTSVAQTLARAISAMLQRRVACALDALLQGEERRAGAPAAARGHQGWSLPTVRGHEARRASTNACEPRGPCALTPRVCVDACSRSVQRATVPDGDRVLPLPRPAASLAHPDVPPGVGRGRDEGTERCRGRRALSAGSLSPPPRWRSPLKKGVVPSQGCTRRRQGRRNTLPETDDAWPDAQRKTVEKSARREGLSRDNGGPHKGSARGMALQESSRPATLLRPARRALQQLRQFLLPESRSGGGAVAGGLVARRESAARGRFSRA